MKIKFTATLAAALLSSSFLLGCNKETKMVDLGVLTEQNVQATLSKPQKPTFVLVVGKDCKTCDVTEQVLKQVAGSRNDVDFVKVDGSIVSAPGGNVALAVPGLGVVVYGQPNKLTSAKEVGNFIDARLANAKKRVEVAEKVKAFRQQIEAANKPFEDRILAVQERGRAGVSAESNKVSELEAKIEEAEKPFQDQINELRKKQREATADLRKQYNEADAALDKAYEPYRAEAEAVQLEQQKASEGLTKEYEQLLVERLNLRNLDSESLPK